MKQQTLPRLAFTSFVVGVMVVGLASTEPGQRARITVARFCRELSSPAEARAADIDAANDAQLARARAGQPALLVPKQFRRRRYVAPVATPEQEAPAADAADSSIAETAAPEHPAAPSENHESLMITPTAGQFEVPAVAAAPATRVMGEPTPARRERYPAHVSTPTSNPPTDATSQPSSSFSTEFGESPAPNQAHMPRSNFLAPPPQPEHLIHTEDPPMPADHTQHDGAADQHAMNESAHSPNAPADETSHEASAMTPSRSMAAFPPTAGGSSDQFQSAAADQSSVTRSESRATVSIRWVVPKIVSLGADVACQLVVENHAGQPAHSVVVEVQLPPLTETTGQCRPQPHRDGDVLTWDLDTLEAGGTRVIDVGLRCKQRGRLAPAAAVTFSQATSAELEIVEPRIEIALDGPEQVVLDQAAVYSLAITNSGSGAVPNVAVDLTHSAGLAHGSGEPLHYLIGTVGPGETRNIQFPLTGTDEGSFEIACTAGTGGMQVATAHKPVAVVRPRLEVALEGPRLRYVDRKAAYHITVRNPGPAPVNNVQIVESVPEGFQFTECTTGGSYDSATRQVAWFVGRLEPQQDATVAVQLTATETGEHRLGTVVRADAGVVGNAETTTAVEGVASVVLDVSDDDDPVEVEGQTAYRIEVTNRGSRAARQVQVAAEVPEEMEVVRLEGPATGTTQGRQVVFPAIAELEPGASATYRVWVTCRSAGQARFRAYFRSEENASPVLEEEPTRIYAD